MYTRYAPYSAMPINQRLVSWAVSRACRAAYRVHRLGHVVRPLVLALAPQQGARDGAPVARADRIGLGEPAHGGRWHVLRWRAVAGPRTRYLRIHPQHALLDAVADPADILGPHSTDELEIVALVGMQLGVVDDLPGHRLVHHGHAAERGHVAHAVRRCVSTDPRATHRRCCP